MAMRIAPDKGKPSVAIEIPLENPLPDYDLDQIEQPTPRDIDALLVSQGFRDLVDDARGVLSDLLANPPQLANRGHGANIAATDAYRFEIAQLTGAICPADDGVYRPGLWIVLQATKAPQNESLQETALEQVRRIAQEFMNRIGLA